MNEKTFRLLEFDSIRQRVAACALNDEAADFIFRDEPCRNLQDTDSLKSLTAVILNLMNSGKSEKRDVIPPIAGLLPKLAVEGTILEIEELYAIGIFIRRGEELVNWLKFSVPDPPKTVNPLIAELEEILSCSFIETEIFRIVDNDGKLRDLSELRDIKKRIAALTRDLENAGSRYTNSEEKRRMLQSVVPSQRDGRLVLAVKANFRGRIKGIVHEVSSTGQTIFVEPEDVVEKNNDLLIEQRRLDAEIRRILRELTGRIAAGSESLNAFHKKIVRLENLRARARYGFETRGFFAAADPENAIVLKKARHPLLGSKAVPLDFSMAGGIRTVIITGPNTGGKTVALKTAGLLAMMNQFGLPLPADYGSCLPVFDGIYADIGDEQSISQSLSTFSSHMTNISDIVKNATENSLVLLDELGSGTDPEEGSAIAMAILDHLIEKKTRLIITTHHGILKNYGYSREAAENASMEFDSKTLSPTFRIVMGIPGESRAVDIAARNGLPPNIVNGAKNYLAEEQADISALIAGLRDKHKELDEAARSGKKEQAVLKEERRKADLKELRLRQKELELKTDGAIKFRRLLEESRKQLENLVREIKEGEITREKTLRVKQFISDLEESVKAENEELLREEELLKEERGRLDEEEKKDSAKRDVKQKNTIVLGPGIEVYAGENRRRGRIIRKDKKKGNAELWVVEVGSLKMTFPGEELTPIIPSPNARPAQYANWAAELAPVNPVTIELNLRGMRMENALDALRQQIDGAVLAGLKSFAVIHGKGDGILQKGVHDYLKADKSVSDYYFSRPELGGFGRTEVVLK